MSYFGPYFGETTTAAVCDYPDPSDVLAGVVYADGTLTGTLGGFLVPSDPAAIESPADIVSRMLVNLGHGSHPELGFVWPVHAGSEPNSPDNVITVYGTIAQNDGKTHVDGKRQQHHGIQVRVRSTTYAVGYAKARAIARALDEDVEHETVVFGPRTYLVHCASKVSDVLELGKEFPTSKRSLFTINCLVPIRQVL